MKSLNLVRILLLLALAVSLPVLEKLAYLRCCLRFGGIETKTAIKRLKSPESPFVGGCVADVLLRASVFMRQWSKQVKVRCA